MFGFNFIKFLELVILSWSSKFRFFLNDYSIHFDLDLSNKPI
jgi:hypothetical protein